MSSLFTRLSSIMLFGMQCCVLTAEVVVVKTGAAQVIIPLDENDRDNYFGSGEKGIFTILTHYQWPTALLYASPAEQNVLFANSENAETDFIQQKLNDINKSYKAVYVPNTIYQLAVLAYFAEHLSDPSQDAALKGMTIQVSDFLGSFLVENVPPFSLTTLGTTHEKEHPYGYIKLPPTFAEFLNDCKKIYDIPSISQIHFLINNELGRQIVAQASNKPITSDIWKSLAAMFLKTIIDNQNALREIPLAPVASADNGLDFNEFNKELENNQLKKNGIVDKTLDVELAAHKQNKALLLNASEAFEQPLGIFENKGNVNKRILTSTLRFSSFDELVADQQKGVFTPHAISYGLFPFTGALYCKWDMPYYYASEPDNYFFSLTIDKKAYAQDRCNNLFIIPPFSALTQIFGLDTMYHVISTVALDTIPQDVVAIDGFEDPFPVQDSTGGILLIKRDPLQHAILSSQFAADNSSLLKVAQGTQWASGEDLLRNYAQATRFYQTFVQRYAAIANAANMTVQQIVDSMLGQKTATPLSTNSLATSLNSLAQALQGLQSKIITTPSEEERLKRINEIMREMESEETKKKQASEFENAPVSSIVEALSRGKKLDVAQKVSLFTQDCKAYEWLNRIIPAKSNDVLRIMTYNVHTWRTPDDQDNVQQVMNIIDTLKPDICIFEESSPTSNASTPLDIEKLLKQRGYDYVFCDAPDYVYDQIQFGNMIAYKSSLKPKTSTKSYAARVMGGQGRCYSTISFTGPYGKINICGTHLSVEDADGAMRKDQLQELMNDIAPIKMENIIVAGDFNAVRKQDYNYSVNNKNVWNLVSEEFKAFSGSPMPTQELELLEKAGFRDCFSFKKIRGPLFTVWTGTVVDFIFLNSAWNLPIAGCYVYYDAASDHLPVIMDISVKS